MALKFTVIKILCFLRFLVEAAEIILANADSEGIFRKSGAVSRQKEIKVIYVISSSGIRCWHHRLAHRFAFSGMIWIPSSTKVRFL